MNEIYKNILNNPSNFTFRKENLAESLIPFAKEALRYTQEQSLTNEMRDVLEDYDNKVEMPEMDIDLNEPEPIKPEEPEYETYETIEIRDTKPSYDSIPTGKAGEYNRPSGPDLYSEMTPAPVVESTGPVKSYTEEKDRLRKESIERDNEVKKSKYEKDLEKYWSDLDEYNKRKALKIDEYENELAKYFDHQRLRSRSRSDLLMEFAGRMARINPQSASALMKRAEWLRKNEEMEQEQANAKELIDYRESVKVPDGLNKEDAERFKRLQTAYDWNSKEEQRLLQQMEMNNKTAQMGPSYRRQARDENAKLQEQLDRVRSKNAIVYSRLNELASKGLDTDEVLEAHETIKTHAVNPAPSEEEVVRNEMSYSKTEEAPTSGNEPVSDEGDKSLSEMTVTELEDEYQNHKDAGDWNYKTFENFEEALKSNPNLTKEDKENILYYLKQDNTEYKQEVDKAKTDIRSRNQDKELRMSKTADNARSWVAIQEQLADGNEEVSPDLAKSLPMALCAHILGGQVSIADNGQISVMGISFGGNNKLTKADWNKTVRAAMNKLNKEIDQYEKDLESIKEQHGLQSNAYKDALMELNIAEKGLSKVSEMKWPFGDKEYVDLDPDFYNKVKNTGSALKEGFGNFFGSVGKGKGNAGGTGGYVPPPNPDVGPSPLPSGF